MEEKSNYFYETVFGFVAKYADERVKVYKFADLNESIEFYTEKKTSKKAQTFLKNFTEKFVCKDRVKLMRKITIDKKLKSLNREETFELFKLTPKEGDHFTRDFAFKIANVKQRPSVLELYKIYDMLDKDINSRTMRIKEWYSLHFPELKCKNNKEYLESILVVKNKDTYEGDEEIEKLAKASMGRKFSDEEIENIVLDVTNILKDIEHRGILLEQINDCIKTNMRNLYALMGDSTVNLIVLCKLFDISNNHLHDMPSAAIQVLGSKKANSKFGVLFASSYLTQAKNSSGKISRMLANKISLCAKIDAEMDENERTDEFGMKFRNNILQKLEEFNNKGTNKKRCLSNKESVKKRKTVEFVKKVE